MTAMTPEQLRVARHALGLPNDTKRSYRNRYLVGSGAAFDAWTGLVATGLAEVAEVEGSRTWFVLTRAGAEAALAKGESLCREDFPVLQAA